MRHLRDPENICAALLVVAFFLPWASFFGTAAGYQLPELGGGWLVLWLLPVLGLAVIVSGVLEVNRWWLSVLTGLLPLAGLLYILAELGTAVFDILHVGAYLTLLAGLGLVAAAFGTRRKQKAAAGPAPEAPDATVE